jgi:hypothetical protein
MQILNYNNHNATEIAEELIASAPDYSEARCKNMSMVQREEALTLSPYLIRSDMSDSYTFNPFRNAYRVGAR